MLDHQGRRGQGLAPGLGDRQGDHLALALDRPLRQHRVVPDDLAEPDLAGHVRGGEDPQDPGGRPGGGDVHPEVSGPHEAGVDRHGVGHVRKPDIVRVQGPAAYLGPGVVAEG